MPDDRPRVLLLRSPSAPDPYVQALHEAGFRAVCAPVLRFAFPHQQALSERLARPAHYAGLIATSPRAVRALSDTLAGLSVQSAAWKAKPAYAVGPRTAGALRTLGFEAEGEETGEAAALADFIARRAEGSQGEALLFVCGNRRRGTLPERLREEGVPFEEQVVYETHARADLDLTGHTGWLAFFSPSGIAAVRQARGFEASAVRFAAIGSTTAAALEEEGWPADAVAAAPTPAALVAAVREAV